MSVASLTIEKFTSNDLCSLRDELMQSGLDSWQAAELIGAFLKGRGYGVSLHAAREQPPASSPAAVLSNSCKKSSKNSPSSLKLRNLPHRQRKPRFPRRLFYL